LVCDGERVWVWRPADGQVIRSKLDDWKRSQPLAQGLLDFGNYAGLLKRYDVAVSTVSGPAADGHRSLALDLKPRAGGPGGDFLLTLRLSTRDFFPFDSELRVGSILARTTFSDVRFNPELAPGQFRFTPPAGADVLDFPAAPRR
jgi:outer membrane lipoprotein-sorting protein